MSDFQTPSFLAPDARLGHWWVPSDGDSDELSSGGLPERREKGILTSSETGHWALLVSKMDLSGDDTTQDRRVAGVPRRDAMWGKVPKTRVSLLDGMRIDPGSWFERDPQETWIGGWFAECPVAWIAPDERADKIEVEFDVGTAWAEKPRGYGYALNLNESWCPQSRTFTAPDPQAHHARIDSARLQLRSECDPDSSRLVFLATMRTYFRIEDNVTFRDIRTRWVRPLYELLSFFWLRSAKVVRIRARHSQHHKWFDLHYPQPLAPSGKQPTDDTTPSIAPFCTLGDILAKGHNFETLLQKYFAWRQGGYAPAVASLIESQNPLLDHSVSARLLNAINSFEAFEKTRTNTKRRFKLHHDVNKLVTAAGSVGSEIEDVWKHQGQKKFGNSLARLRTEYAAHSKQGNEKHFPTEPELLEQEWHLTALQWLLRQRYLESIGLHPTDAEALVTKAIRYREERAAIRTHYQLPEPDSSQDKM